MGRGFGTRRKRRCSKCGNYYPADERCWVCHNHIYDHSIGSVLPEILSRIFGFLDYRSLCSVSQVCSKFREITLKEYFRNSCFNERLKKLTPSMVPPSESIKMVKMPHTVSIPKRLVWYTDYLPSKDLLVRVCEDFVRRSRKIEICKKSGEFLRFCPLHSLKTPLCANFLQLPTGKILLIAAGFSNVSTFIVNVYIMDSKFWCWLIKVIDFDAEGKDHCVKPFLLSTGTPVIALGCNDRIRIIHPLTKEDRDDYYLEGYSGAVLCMRTWRLRPTRSFLISVSKDGTIRIWDVQTREFLKTITINEPVTWITASPDGKIEFGTQNGKTGIIKI